MLQKCMQCGAYLTLDSRVIAPESIIERVGLTKENNMRTLTAEINSELYDKLQELIKREIGEERDPTAIMSEIIALGLRDYKKTLS